MTVSGAKKHVILRPKAEESRSFASLRMTFHMTFQYSLVWLLLAIAMSGCSGAKAAARPDLVWPLPPDPPRVRYERSLTSEADVATRKGFWSRARTILIGRTEPAHLLEPIAVASDGTGRVYVADTAVQAIHVFDFPGKKYRQFFLVPEGRLLSPVGIAPGPDGSIYVSDSQLNRVYLFGPDGAVRRKIGEQAGLGRASGIALNPQNGWLYVVDTANHWVVAFDGEGRETLRFGERGVGPGQFNFPTHIAADRDGNLYIADSLNFRIQIMDAQGRFLRSIGKLGNRLGEFSKPKGVAVDGGGRVYVVDGIYDTVQVFNREGELLMHFGRSGSEEGAFWLPNGMAVDAGGGIYVADTHNQRVQVFRFLGRTEPEAAPQQERPRAS